jgi:hypothetical protein
MCFSVAQARLPNCCGLSDAAQAQAFLTGFDQIDGWDAEGRQFNLLAPN